MRCQMVTATGLLSSLLALSLVPLAMSPIALAQTPAPQTRKVVRWNASSNGRIRFAKAFVVDHRLSALRREPDIKSTVIRRLSPARAVYILESKISEDQTRFYRVALTRRTRGWIHESAVAIPGRSGEDQRLVDLIPDVADPIDRMVLCRLFIDQFRSSPLMPRVLLLMAEEADRAAVSLIGRARRRLAAVPRQSRVRVRDLYLTDTGLDRYSKLRISFDFNEASERYEYDGRAYREIIRRFPRSEEAKRAQAWLERKGGTKSGH